MNENMLMAKERRQHALLHDMHLLLRDAVKKHDIFNDADMQALIARGRKLSGQSGEAVGWREQTIALVFGLLGESIERKEDEKRASWRRTDEAPGVL